MVSFGIIVYSYRTLPAIRFPVPTGLSVEEFEMLIKQQKNHLSPFCVFCSYMQILISTGYSIFIFPMFCEYFNFDVGLIPNGVTHKENLELQK